MECFPDYTFSYEKQVSQRTSLTKNTKNKSPLRLEEKKETLASAIFCKICYVACAINCVCKLICRHACLHEHDRIGLIGKPEKYSIFSLYFSFI